jgi:chemotaxis protein methyltransferase CheR
MGAQDSISDAELASFTEVIRKKYGIDFTDYERNSLKRGVQRVINKYRLGSLMGLWSKVLQDQEFFFKVIDDLMVNLTELFRNPDTWIQLKESLLDEFKDRSQLCVWHAGCSTGEEVYTMAIVLAEKGLIHKTQTLATDLSSRALEQAEKACYPRVLFERYGKTALSYLKEKDLEHFFRYEEDHVYFKDAFRKHIRFQRHDLVQEEMPRNFQIIFCRNVLIYFNENLKMRVLEKLYRSLLPGGYLIIGYYDMLPSGHEKYFEVSDPNTRVYRKAAQEQEKPLSALDALSEKYRSNQEQR